MQQVDGARSLDVTLKAETALLDQSCLLVLLVSMSTVLEVEETGKHQRDIKL